MHVSLREYAGVALAAALALLGGAGAVSADTAQGRCTKDALERWYCAVDPKGVAVVDNLGSVVCSAGSCIEVEDEWECSPVSGGKAEQTPDGPLCEGGCRAPRAVDCTVGMGPG